MNKKLGIADFFCGMMGLKQRSRTGREGWHHHRCHNPWFRQANSIPESFAASAFYQNIGASLPLSDAKITMQRAVFRKFVANFAEKQ